MQPTPYDEMSSADILKLAREYGADIRCDQKKLVIKGVLPPLLRESLNTHEPAITDLVMMEHRRNAAMILLNVESKPDKAFFTDDFSDPDNVIVVIAYRSGETRELIIPRESYDPFLFTEGLQSFHDGVIQ